MSESFLDNLHVTFTRQTSEQQSLDDNVRDFFKHEVQRAIYRRHQDIVSGYLQQFPRPIRRTLRHIQELVPYPKKANKKSLAAKLSATYRDVYRDEKDAAKAITQAWDSSKQRTLVVDGRPMSIMRFSNGSYSGNLNQILAVLRPDLTKKVITDWMRVLQKKRELDETMPS